MKGYKNQNGGSILFWIFFMLVIFLTWLASFLVKKTVETTNQLTSQISVTPSQTPDLSSPRFNAGGTTASSSPMESERKGAGMTMTSPQNQKQPAKEIFFEPSIKDNILLQ